MVSGTTADVLGRRHTLVRRIWKIPWLVSSSETNVYYAGDEVHVWCRQRHCRLIFAPGASETWIPAGFLSLPAAVFPIPAIPPPIIRIYMAIQMAIMTCSMSVFSENYIKPRPSRRSRWDKWQSPESRRPSCVSTQAVGMVGYQLPR